MNTIGLILAGGQSSRFNGRDKARVMFQDRIMVDWVIQSVAPQVDDILLNPRPNASWPRVYPYPCVYEQENNKSFGPLAGVLAAYRYLTDNRVHFDHLAICPCDTPLIDQHWIMSLRQTIGCADVCYIETESEALKERQKHYAHALITRQACSTLAAYIESGRRSLIRWYEGLESVVYLSENDGFFININSLKDLSNFES